MVKTYWRWGTGARTSSATQVPNWRTRFWWQEGQKYRPLHENERGERAVIKRLSALSSFLSSSLPPFLVVDGPRDAAARRNRVAVDGDGEG